MLSVLLTIGKGIGIVLLALILLLLFLLGIVLFVPVRYTGRAEKKDEVKAFCRIGWLCRILSFRLSYENGELSAQLRIFGFPWKGKKKSPAHTHKKSKEPEKPAQEQMREPKRPVSEDTNTGEQTDAGFAGRSETDREKAYQETVHPQDVHQEETYHETEPGSESEKKSVGHPVWKRILDKIRKIWYTITSICDKILQIKDKISEYRAIWQEEETQEAFAKCKTELARLLRHVKPKKLKAEITFGMEDPALTGEILGAASIFYAYTGKNVLIHPDFENAVFAGDIYIRGRIRVGPLLLIVGRLYFDKNIRKLIQRFRKGEADG